jgi:hypothetical protein
MSTPAENLGSIAKRLSERVDENGGFTIMGQTMVLPRTGWGSLTVVGFFVAAVFAIYYIVHADVKTLQQIGISFFHVSPGGEPQKESGIVSYGFWTPSKDTADELRKALGNQTPGTGSWLLEKVTDEKLAEFGQKLHSDSEVEAYRRAPIYGQGRKFSDAKTPLVSGWWWTLRAKKGFTIEKLSKIYHDEWKNESTLYVEVFDPSGTFK